MNITEILGDEKTLLRRTKSLCSLSDEGVFRGNGGFFPRTRSRVDSGSSDAFVVHHAGSESSLEGREGRVAVDLAHLTHLEQKMDRLTDVFLEQCRLLSSIKEEMQHSRDAVERSGNMQITQLFAKLANSNVGNQPSFGRGEDSGAGPGNSRARTLLDAIEARAPVHSHRDVGDAVASFLQSDELTERVVSATAASAREVVGAAMARDVAAVYLPVLQRAQRRLARYASRALDDAFAELEEHCAAAARHVCRASRQLQRALDRHHASLQRRPPTLIDSLRQTAERVLDKEMEQWRQKVLETMASSEACSDGDWREGPVQDVDYPSVPDSPLSADSDHSPMDRLMQAAVINKHMEDGDVNGSFERALCSMDLSLVMAACRAAPPARVFSPCRLRPPVLLALLQQLATDMLGDTQLKCRYLEEAIISLNTSHPETRAHLPTVVGEVRKHLMRFLASYPNHVASRRITLIVMAADNLLKQ